MADAQASGACGSNTVWVQVPSPALFILKSRDALVIKYPGFFLYIATDKKLFGGICSSNFGFSLLSPHPLL